MQTQRNEAQLVHELDVLEERMRAELEDVDDREELAAIENLRYFVVDLRLELQRTGDVEKVSALFGELMAQLRRRTFSPV